MNASPGGPATPPVMANTYASTGFVRILALITIQRTAPLLRRIAETTDTVSNVYKTVNARRKQPIVVKMAYVAATNGHMYLQMVLWKIVAVKTSRIVIKKAKTPTFLLENAAHATPPPRGKILAQCGIC